MFESLSSLVNSQYQRSSASRSGKHHKKSHYPSPVDTTMAGQVPYSTQMGTAKSSRRTSLSPTSASTQTSQYSASRHQSVSSSTSSPSSQAQNLLSKVASNGAGSPPGSRLMTPAMTPFPSPADEGAPFPGGMLGLTSSNTQRPGTERSQNGYISFPDFEQFRKSFEDCNMTAGDESRQQKS